MRILDQTRTHLLSSARRWVARLPAPIGQRVRPASLGLHLSPMLPGECGSESDGTVPNWSVLRSAVVELVADQGPLPVEVFTTGRALDDGALGLIRLAHRLDCPVTVWTDGVGLNAEGAGALLDIGCAAVAVTVASLDDAVQRSVVGNDVAEATDALVALIAAREDRSAATQVFLALPWAKGVEPEVRGLVGWAHQTGVDAVVLVPPIRGGAVGPLDHWPEVLRGLGVRGVGKAEERYLRNLSSEDGSLPGVLRASAAPMARFRPCPIVGARAALDGTGALFACPFHPPMGPVGESIVQTWKADTEHRAAARGCARRCRHPALALGPGLPGPLGRPMGTIRVSDGNGRR